MVRLDFFLACSQESKLQANMKDIKFQESLGDIEFGTINKGVDLLAHQVLVK
jgi:hypothetical protein